jgi:ribosomal protein L15
MTELYHHGVKGMKWGVRKKRYGVGARVVRGHAGPGVYVGSKKHQLEGYKRDLDILDKGGHLSVGMTKKRQEKYDRRDRKALEQKISKLENETAKKITRKVVENKAADALDKLSEYMFFNGSDKPNNFAVRVGMQAASDSLRNGEGVYSATLRGLSDYKFFKK